MAWSKEGLSRLDYLQKLTKIPLHSAAFGLPLGDARWAVDALRREATTPNEAFGVLLIDLAVRFAAGESLPREAYTWEMYGPGWATNLIQQAAIEPGAYGDLATAMIARETAGGFRLPVAGGSMRWPPTQLCFGEMYRAATGDTSHTRDAIRRLGAFAALDPPPMPRDDWQSLDFRVCSLLLEVLLEGTPARGERRPRLDALDSLMHDEPRWFAQTGIVVPSAFANFSIARLREAQGDLPAALAAIRRREVDYFPSYLWSVPAFLRQEGRLAALTGDIAGARRAYDEYLTVRTAPMSALRMQRDSVIAERAALTR